MPRAGRGQASLVLVTAWGPKQQVLRPKQLDDASFSKSLHREARVGEYAVLDEFAEAKVEVNGDACVIGQRERSFRIGELGSMVVVQPALGGGDHGLRWLIEEDVADRLELSLRFASRVTGIVDGTRG